MTVHSHTPTSLLKRIKAMHDGTAATTTTTTTVAMTATHHHDPHSSKATSTAGHSRAVLLGVLLVAQLMVILDITAVNIALPSLARDLQLSGATVSWTITSYSLVFGSLLLFGGRLSDLVGRRRMFLTGLGIFTVSSVASAVAGTAAELFAARGRPGPRSRPALTGRPLDHHECVSGQGAGESARSLGRGRRRRRGDWRPRRRRADRGRRLAPDLLRQHPGRDGLAVAALHVIPRDDAGSRAGVASTSPAPCLAPRASPRSFTRSPRQIRAAGDRPRRSGSQRSASWVSPPSPPGSVTPRSRSCGSSGSLTVLSAAACS